MYLSQNLNPMNKTQCIKIKGYPRISVARTELKSDWKCGLKCWFFVVKIVPAPNTGSWRSDLLLKCYEFSSMAPGLSYEPNASNRTQNRLRTREKRALGWECASCRRLNKLLTSAWFGDQLGVELMDPGWLGSSDNSWLAPYRCSPAL